MTKRFYALKLTEYVLKYALKSSEILIYIN